jgi:hypothetical protein
VLSSLELLAGAWGWSFSSTGTITLAVIGCLLYPLADLLFRYRDFGVQGLREYWGYRLKYSAAIAVFWLAMLFSWHLFRSAA